MPCVCASKLLPSSCSCPCSVPGSAAEPSPSKPGQRCREHEAMSCLLVDHICQQYNIDLCLDEQTRVKDLIAGDRVAAVVSGWLAGWDGHTCCFLAPCTKRDLSCAHPPSWHRPTGLARSGSLTLWPTNATVGLMGCCRMRLAQAAQALQVCGPLLASKNTVAQLLAPPLPCRAGCG